MARITHLQAMQLLTFFLILQLGPSPLTQHQVLKPTDVGLFNPDLPNEHRLGPVAMVGSDTVYRDVYTWVDSLKDLSRMHGTKEVRQVIQPCLRGSAATWWIVELTDKDRKKLRNANLEGWFALLIERFKMQQSVAIKKLISSSYTQKDLDQSPRVWVHEMLRYARAAGLESTYVGLYIIRSRFVEKLRKDIPLPTPTTELIDFLEQLDTLYLVWREQEHGKVHFPLIVDTLMDGTPRSNLDVSKLRPVYDSRRRSHELCSVAAKVLTGLTKYWRQIISDNLIVYLHLRTQVYAIFRYLISQLTRLFNLVVSKVLPHPPELRFRDLLAARCHEIRTSGTSTAWQLRVCSFLLADGI